MWSGWKKKASSPQNDESNRQKGAKQTMTKNENENEKRENGKKRIKKCDLQTAETKRIDHQRKKKK